MRGSNAGIWEWMGHRVIVADAAGKIVTDSAGAVNGSMLSYEQIAGGQPIQVGGQATGTILVGAGEMLPGTPAGEFLRALNRSILTAVLIAGSLALLLGSILFFQITAPLRTLKAAASAIAAGDLSQRVPIRSMDELGALAVTFNAMVENLDRAESQRRQMVADVAHELRTPLSVIQANLEAMQDGVLPLDAAEIASLHEETVLLTRLVADLHLLSLAEAGQLKLDQEAVAPGVLIQKSTERLQQNAQARGICVQVEASQVLPPVWADADRISQVIGNLLSNALRYTSPGGVITVRVETLDDLPAEKTASVLVSVTDTGSGIPAADLPHIFNRFYRADKSRARATGGSGLGLAIIKHIVEAHGGRVWAESPVRTAAKAENRGTRISFTLPAAHKRAPAHE
jgi:signal transduction histidine kinase